MDFHGYMSRMHRATGDIKDVKGLLVINGQPFVTDAFVDDKGVARYKNVYVRYKTEHGRPQGRFSVVKPAKKGSGNNKEEVDDQTYAEVLSRIECNSVVGKQYSIEPNQNLSHLGKAELITINKYGRSVCVVRSVYYDELERYCKEGIVPESFTLTYKDSAVDLFNDKSHKDTLLNHFLQDALGSYMSFTKLMNSSFMASSNLLIPHQLAYLPFMYSGDSVVNPVSSTPVWNNEYMKLFGELDANSVEVPIFSEVGANVLRCKVITNKRACELLGFSKVYPLTGYMLLGIIVARCCGVAINPSDLIAAEASYLSSLSTKVLANFDSVETFRESFINELGKVV